MSDGYSFEGFQPCQGRLVARFRNGHDVRIVSLDGVYCPSSEAEEMPDDLRRVLLDRAREFAAIVRTSHLVLEFDSDRRRNRRST